MEKQLKIDEIIEITQQKFETEFQELPEGMDDTFSYYFKARGSHYVPKTDIEIYDFSDDYAKLPLKIRSFFENECLKNGIKRVGD